MRIMVVSSNVFAVPLTGYGGLEHVAWQCAAGLAARGHGVMLAAPDGSECPGVQVVHTGPAGRHTEAQAYDRYWKLLPGCDVVIDHSWNKHSYLLKMEGKLPAPVLGVWHAPADAMFRELPQVERLCTVLLSEDHKAHYEALFSRPGRVCYNAVCSDFYRPMSTVARTRRALFLARFSAIKGADLAVEACKRAGVGLDLVGDTSITNEPDYAEKVRNMCDGELIRLVGPETRGGCVLRYSRASFFLHPNRRFREPFGLAPVEAQLCGLPVVCWDHGAMRETVLHGRTGVHVRDDEDLHRAVCHFRDSPPDEALRAACREHAMKFSIAAMCERYEALCVEALNGGW